jgi:hypothetical protein
MITYVSTIPAGAVMRQTTSRYIGVETGDTIRESKHSSFNPCALIGVQTVFRELKNADDRNQHEGNVRENYPRC